MLEKTDYFWKLPSKASDIVSEISDKLKLNPIVSRILVNRGLESTDAGYQFLYGTLEDLHPPFLMNGMDVAVKRVIQAVRNNEKVLVFGDYDVDGISATSLLVGYFRELGVEVSFYIPHRIDEGYGLNFDAVKKFAEEKIGLVVTVDCGVTSIEEIKLAKELGVDVIITDHHQVSQTLPEAYAVLNPARDECEYPFKSLAGVGIGYKLVAALNESMIRDGVKKANEVPSLKKMLDIVALGTLADMVPLVGENRILVKYGLEEMSRSKRVGLRALMNLGKFGSRPIVDIDIGFFMAPRLNAIGRLQNAGLGVELLTIDDKFRAKEIARKLDTENTKRQNIQGRILNEVLPLIENEVDLENDKAIVLASEGWHPGVIGIVASKVVEQFNLPTILLDIENGVCRGSARSIPSFHIYGGLNKCRDLLLHFGGHKYAAGLSLEANKIDMFKERFKKIASELLYSEEQQPVLEIDSEVPLNRFNISFVEDILELGPFGPQNSYPLFLSRGIKFCEEPIYVGREGEHVRFEAEYKGHRVDGIGYGMAKKFQEWEDSNKEFDIVFIPNIVTRGGMSDSVEIKLQDARPAV